MVPGTTFETVIRTAAETGLIKGAENNIDEWVAKRTRRCITMRKELTCNSKATAAVSRSMNARLQTVVPLPFTRILPSWLSNQNQLEAWNKELENRVTAQVDELQHVEQLKRFFPPQLADAIVSDENTGILEDHRSEVSVIFCDLRGFTEFSSLSEPEEEMRVLREYHAVVCPLIFKYGATLEHFAGDGVMSFLNDPLPCPDHIRRAIEMANAMRSGMNELIIKWRDRGGKSGVWCRDWNRVCNHGTNWHPGAFPLRGNRLRGEPCVSSLQRSQAWANSCH